MPKRLATGQGARQLRGLCVVDARSSELSVSEGFVALTRVVVRVRGSELVATLNVVDADWLGEGIA